MYGLDFMCIHKKRSFMFLFFFIRNCTHKEKPTFFNFLKVASTTVDFLSWNIIPQYNWVFKIFLSQLDEMLLLYSWDCN